MQSITKIELGWIIEELEKSAAALQAESVKSENAGLAAGMMALRSEQFASIAGRFKEAIKAGSKRIEIKY